MVAELSVTGKYKEVIELTVQGSESGLPLCGGGLLGRS